MFDAKAFDACLASNKSDDDPDSTLAILTCQSSLPSGVGAVPAEVLVTIVIDPLVVADSDAEVRRRFVEAIATLNRKVTLEAVPRLNCTSKDSK